MKLVRFGTHEIVNVNDLATAIRQEAETIASDAGCDVLEENSEDAREELRQRVVEDATNALCRIGDIYIDPLGVKWKLTQGDEPKRLA